MSNVIKAYSVRYDDFAKRIDNQLKIEQQIIVKRKLEPLMGDLDGSFCEGIKAVVVDKLPSEEDNEIADKLIEQANNKAKDIIDQAMQEAEKIKSDAFTAAQKKGYDDGLQKGNLKLQKLCDEYEEKEIQRKKTYDTLIDQAEHKMVEIIALMVTKLTGILIENKEDIILYLVEKALNNLDKSTEFTIMVSKEDYDYLLAQKNHLLSSIGREVKLDIKEDLKLSKNQCRIETDIKVIDCSLDVQLNSLITDLKLLGGV